MNQHIKYLHVGQRSFSTLAASSGKRNVPVWRPSIRLSVCPVAILTVTLQGAACDAANAHFGPTVRRTDILVSKAVVRGHAYWTYCSAWTTKLVSSDQLRWWCDQRSNRRHDNVRSQWSINVGRRSVDAVSAGSTPRLLPTKSRSPAAGF